MTDEEISLLINTEAMLLNRRDELTAQINALKAIQRQMEGNGDLYSEYDPILIENPSRCKHGRHGRS